MGEALTDIAASLYALPPEEFVAARTEAVARARAAGDRKQAAEIARLRKPTVAAWLVNLLAQRRPDLIADLLALGEQLRVAQRELRGDRLRELSERRRRAVGALAQQARALAVAAGRGVRDPLPLAAVESTLTAALVDGDVAEQVRVGQLTKPVEYAGFGELPRPRLRLVPGGNADGHPERQRRAQESAAKSALREARTAARVEARRELAAANAELAAAETARAAAERAISAARRRVAAARAKVAELGAGARPGDTGAGDTGAGDTPPGQPSGAGDDGSAE